MSTPPTLLTRTLAVLLLSVPGTLSAQLAKQTIDEELLSGLVQAKQEEVRTRVLKNLIQNTIPEANYATYNTLADVLEILTTEKNKGAMTRDLVKVVGEYAVAYGITWYFITHRRGDQADRICHRPGHFDTAKPGPFAEWEQISQAVRAVSSPKKKWGRTQQKVKLIDASEWSLDKKKHIARYGREKIEEAKNDEELIQFHDWLLDTTIALLRDPARMEKGQVDTAFVRKLRATGLFGTSKQRPWQSTVRERYEAMIERDSAELAVVVAALKAEMKDLTGTVDGFVRMAKAVGLQDPDLLRNLDLTSLTGNDHFGTHVLKGGAVKNLRVAGLFDLFRHAVELYRRTNSDDRFIARFADILNRYVLLEEAEYSEEERFGFRIDVEGVILSLEDKVLEGLNSPTRKCWLNVRPYFTIGLNYGAYADRSIGFAPESTRGVPTVAWAGEKFGLKWRLFDWRYTHSREANEPFLYHGKKFIRRPRPSVPLVSNCYLSVFASGLLYSVADLRTESSYDGALLGAGAGMTFFNDLELNVNYVVPLVSTASVQQNLDAGFWNLGFDIPIFDYIRAARDKRNLK